MRRLRSGVLAIGVSLVVVPAPARADEPPSAERLKSAAEEFDLGRRAFLAKDFDGAAVHFESAFRDAPRAEALRLAIRARREAKQLARAGTLAAIAADRYPNDPATAQLAKDTLAEARRDLHEYDVDCAPECALAADGRVVSQADALKHRIFLDPGAHELGVSFRQGSVARRVEAKRGGKDALSFEAPPPPPPVTEPPGTPPAPKEAVEPARSPKPLGPVVFFAAAGVTVALGAATIVSGVDAKNNPGVDAVRTQCAGKDESCPAYQDGKAAETRTNVLLGATLGVAVVTGVMGLFFTEWSSSTKAGSTAGRVGFGASPVPGGAVGGVSGRF
ncbi:MAG: hypothetical protein KF819_20250 [Labilithrix sp.]|nr:hypothetical protein [Labilithrix sp.]